MINLTTKEIFDLIISASSCIGAVDQDEVVQRIAHILITKYNISRDEIREILLEFGFILQEPCVECGEYLLQFDGTGHPVCSECKGENDSVS